MSIQYLTTSEALLYVLKHDKSANLKRLAKALDCSSAHISYMRDKKTYMAVKLYEKWKLIYPTIVVTDLNKKNHLEYTLGTLED